MDRVKNRAVGLLLALGMLLSLAACGKNKEGGDAQRLSGTVYVPEFIDLDLDSLWKNYDLDSGCTDGTNVYLLVSVYPDWEAGEEGNTRYTILRMPLDGGEPAELENFKAGGPPEGYDQSNTYLNNLRAGADGSLWVEERTYAYKYDLPEDFDPENDSPFNYDVLEELDLTYQIQLDSTGTEIIRIETGDLEEKIGGDDRVYYDGNLFDKDGDMFVAAGKKLVALDTSMNVRFTLEDESMWGGNPVLLSDGSVGVLVSVSDSINQTYSRQVRTVDKTAKKWGDSYEVPQNAHTIYSGGGDYLFYYKNGEDIYGYKAEVPEGEEHGRRLLSWLDADINSDEIEFFSFLSDGRVVAMTRSWYSDNGPEVNLIILTATDRSQLPEKTILTYATMYLSQEARNRILAFNKGNATHRIEVTDYSQYSDDGDYMTGVTKLNTEILAGKVPDIINADGLPIRQYGTKGILEDLWPFIDSDPDLGREKLMDRVFTAAEQDGKLYQVFNSFTIRTIAGAAKVVGEDMGWTMAEFQEALASMPEGCTPFGEGSTKDGMLSTMLSQNLDSFVDWETGECRFDGDNFKTALAFCNTFPLEFDYSNYEYSSGDSAPARIADGRQLLLDDYLYDFRRIQMVEAMFGGTDALEHFYWDYQYGPDGYSVTVSDVPVVDKWGDTRESNRLIPGRYITFKGYPTEDGSCGSCFDINGGLAMSSVCKDKDAAWSFMRQLLLPAGEDDRYGRWGYPVNKADFEAMAQQAMEVEYMTDGEGNQVLDLNGSPIQESKGGWGWDSLSIDIQALSQIEYDQIMELYNAITSVSSYDTTISEIVSEVAGSYFAGDKSLDDAASLIQNKVRTYVNENR